MNYTRTARAIGALLLVAVLAVSAGLLVTGRDANRDAASPRSAAHWVHPILGHPAPEPDMSLPANNAPDVNLQPDYLVCDDQTQLCWSLWVDGPGY